MFVWPEWLVLASAAGPFVAGAAVLLLRPGATGRALGIRGIGHWALGIRHWAERPQSQSATFAPFALGRSQRTADGPQALAHCAWAAGRLAWGSLRCRRSHLFGVRAAPLSASRRGPTGPDKGSLTGKQCVRHCGRR